jgi:hypothetical protein
MPYSNQAQRAKVKSVDQTFVEAAPDSNNGMLSAIPLQQ